MKHKKMIALVMAVAVSASAFAVSAFAKTADSANQEASAQQAQGAEQQGKHSKKEKVAEPENAVGKDAAKQAALKDAGLAEDAVEKLKARVSAAEDSTMIYKVHFTANDTWYSYKIDALSGKILDKQTQTAEEHEASGPQGRQHKGGRRGGTAESENGKEEPSAQTAENTSVTSA